MSSYDDIRSAVTNAETEYNTLIGELNETRTSLTESEQEVTGLESQLSTVQRDFDAYKLSHPDTQPPPPPTNEFLVGISTGPKSPTVSKADARRSYFNASQVSSMLTEAENRMKAGIVPLISTKAYGTTTVNNWASIASGSGDSSWVNPMLNGLEALGAKYNLPVYFAVHHEPDDEILDGWKTSDFVNMQMHIATLAKSKAHIKYGVIVMGYHQFDQTDVPMSSVVPPQLAAIIDYVGFDPYDEKGQKDWPAYVAKVKNWIAGSGNKNLEFGVFETGISQSYYASKPNWIHTTSKVWKDAGASVWAYWSSQVNTSKPNWILTSAGVTEFEKVVTENNA